MLWLLPLQRYFQFSGRAGRAEFWQFILAAGAAILLALILDIGATGPYGVPTLALLLLLGLAIPAYAVTFRRLHDRGQSGWIVGIHWILNAVAAAIGGIRESTRGSLIDAPFMLVYWGAALAGLAVLVYILVQVASSGDPGGNRYGPPPSDTRETALQFDAVVGSLADKARGFAPPIVDPRATQPDRLAQLERLARLRQDGAITEAEFEQQKAALLAQPER